MLCDACKHNEAVVHRIMVINGVKHEQHLCAQCAQKATTISFKLPSLADLTNVSFKAQQPNLTCVCGMTLKDFKEGGLVGCPECYTTFSDALTPIIKRAQGGRIQHVGEQPRSCGPASENNLEALRKELSAAIENEQYEQAAVLRDRIKALTEEEKQ